MSQPPAWQWSNTTTILIRESDRSIYFLCKWLMDVILATLLLLLSLPLMLLVAILIKLDSAGPVFFIQERVGARRRSEGRRTIWNIRNFPCYKFRSMIRNADPSPHQAAVRAFIGGRVEGFKGARAKFKLNDDPRVTRVGRILRKTSLDELPQLINVLKGEMSLVGPRPVPTYEVAEYQDCHRERLATLPGITGLWQVKGRCQVSFDEMVRMDVEYVRNQSLGLDIKILFLTVSAVLSGRGAE